jgi:hypothetical protein
MFVSLCNLQSFRSSQILSPKQTANGSKPHPWSAILAEERKVLRSEESELTYIRATGPSRKIVHRPAARECFRLVLLLFVVVKLMLPLLEIRNDTSLFGPRTRTLARSKSRVPFSRTVTLRLFAKNWNGSPSRLDCSLHISFRQRNE